MIKKMCVPFLLALFSFFGLLSAQSQNCYFCNSEVHGTACHNPINPNLIQTQRCSDGEMESSTSYYSEMVEFFEQHTIFARPTDVDVRNTTTFSNVCFSMTYEFSSQNVTVKGCEQEQKNTNVGIMDVCEYYRQLAPIRITNFNCSICNGHLCNYETMQGNDSTKILTRKFILGLLLAIVIFY